MSAYFGYPSRDQANTYCNSFRTAFAGTAGMWITMHIIAVASFMTFKKNLDRESGIFDHPSVHITEQLNPAHDESAKY